MKHLKIFNNLFQYRLEQTIIDSPYVALISNSNVVFYNGDANNIHPVNEVWYITTDNQPITLDGGDIYGNVISNTWDSNTGCFEMVFDRELIKIGLATFEAYPTLITIIIPDSVKIIGSFAFEDNPTLVSFYIPSSIETIEIDAFWNCTSLEQIIYKGKIYTSKSAIENALINNGVTIGTNLFTKTKLSA